MDQTPAPLSNRPPTMLPAPDFSVPPPTTISKTIVVEKQQTSAREQHGSYSSREREKYSPRASSSRDYRSRERSHSHYSSSSYARYDRPSDRHTSRRYDNYQSYKHRRSKSRSSSRHSPSRRCSTRKSPYSSRDKISRSNSRRNSPHRDDRVARASSRAPRKSTKDPQTERERLLAKWRKNYCETSEQISKKLQELANDEEQVSWIRASPADIHYKRIKDIVVESTPRLDTLCTLFDDELLKRADKIRANQAPYNVPNRRRKIRVCRHKCKFEFICTMLHGSFS